MRSGDRSIGWFQTRIERAIGTPSHARQLARCWRTGGVGLIILCLLVYIPGLWTIPPVDRDESRFAQASRQMLESGTLEGWVVPRVQDKPRLNKPPLIYWLQAGSAAILGDAPGQWAWLDGVSENIWVYRVPSVLSAMLTVLLTWRLGTGMFDPRAAWLAAALLAVCPMVVWDAHQARADQLLLAMTTATMMCLWNVWRRSEPKHARDRRYGHPMPCDEKEGIKSPRIVFSSTPRSLSPSIPLFWLFLSLGIMTKGPITPMIAGLTILSLCLISRDWSLVRRLRPVMGVVIVALIVAPWVILVGREVGWSKYLSIVYDETIGRSAGAKEGHWGPPGYHIVLLGVLFWPGSLLTAAAIGRAWRRGLMSKRNAEGTEKNTAGTEKPNVPSEQLEAPRKRGFSSLRTSVASSLRRFYHSRPGRPAELFCLAWMLPAWVVFELVGTKLPHYTMPMYPAVALLSSRMIFTASTSRHRKISAVDQETLRWHLSIRDAKCPVCCYNLRGVQVTTCPECGEPFMLDLRRLRVVHPGAPQSQRAGNILWLVIGALATAGLLATLGVVVGSRAFWFWNAPSTNFWRIVFSSYGVSALLTAIVCLLFPMLLAWYCLRVLAASYRQLRRGAPETAMPNAIHVLVLVYMLVLGILLPFSRTLWLTQSVSKDVRYATSYRPENVAVLGSREDSLVFLLRGKHTELSSPFDAMAWAYSAPNKPVVIAGDRWGEVSAAFQDMFFDLESWHWFSHRGWNYSKGKSEVTFVLWKKK